jgi:hypothetical protein
MRDPLPVREIREILGDKGFLRLYGQDTFLFVSDLPRRVSPDALAAAGKSLRECGFIAQVDLHKLLLIDMQPARWKALLESFQAAEATPFPQDETLHRVYALARLLMRHPSDFARQPMDMIRAAMKQYASEEGLPKFAPQLHARCAEKLRRGDALPSALAKVLFAWLGEHS